MLRVDNNILLHRFNTRNKILPLFDLSLEVPFFELHLMRIAFNGVKKFSLAIFLFREVRALLI